MFLWDERQTRSTKKKQKGFRMKKVILFFTGLFAVMGMAFTGAYGGSTADAQSKLEAISTRKQNKSAKSEDKAAEKSLKELVALNKKIEATRGKLTQAKTKADAIDGTKKKAAKTKAIDGVKKLQGELKDLRAAKKELSTKLGLSVTKTTGSKTTKSKTPAKKTTTKKTATKTPAKKTTTRKTATKTPAKKTTTRKTTTKK